MDHLLACHGHRCLAWQLAHAFYSMRDVTCLGPTDRHQFWGDSLRSRSDGSGEKEAASVRATWNVTKINRSNVAQRRILSIEKEKELYIITTRDMHMRLKRRIPVSQIVQLEASLADPRRCGLYIEAEPLDGNSGGGGAKAWDSFLAITQDTVFDLVFPTPLDRDTFLEKITLYREEVMKTEKGLLQAALGGAVAADAAQKLAATAINSRTADGRPSSGPGMALSAITRMRLTAGAGGAGGISADVAKQAVRDVSTRFAGAPMLAGGGGGGGGGNPFMAAVTAALRNRGLTPDSSLVNGDNDGASSDLASSVLTGSSALGAAHAHQHALAHALGGHQQHHALITVGAGEKNDEDEDDEGDGEASGGEAAGGNGGGAGGSTGGGGKGGGGANGGHSSEDEEDAFAANPHGGAVIAKIAARRSSMKALVGRHGGLRMVNLMKKMKAQGLLSAALSSAAAGGGAGAKSTGLAALASSKGLSGIAALAALRQRESLSLSGDSSTTADQANGHHGGQGVGHAAPLGWSPSVHAIGIISPAGSTSSMLSAGRGGQGGVSVSPTKAGNVLGAAGKKKMLLQAYRDQSQGGGLSSRSLGSASDVGASIAASNAGYRYDADDDRSAPPMSSARSDQGLMIEEEVHEEEGEEADGEGEGVEESGSAVSPVPDAEDYTEEGGSDVQVGDGGSDVGSGAEEAVAVVQVEVEDSPAAAPAPAPAPSPPGGRKSGRFLAAAITKAAKAAQAEQQAAAAQQGSSSGGGGHGKLVKQRSVRFADE